MWNIEAKSLNYPSKVRRKQNAIEKYGKVNTNAEFITGDIKKKYLGFIRNARRKQIN